MVNKYKNGCRVVCVESEYQHYRCAGHVVRYGPRVPGIPTFLEVCWDDKTITTVREDKITTEEAYKRARQLYTSGEAAAAACMARSVPRV